MIESVIGWIEIRSVPEASADLVDYEIKVAWLIRYPLPNKILVHRGKEFFT